jgi:hypothetical protein
MYSFSTFTGHSRAKGSTFVAALDMPGAFLALYHQKPITAGESAEEYDRLFVAMAGDACPQTFSAWVDLKLEVDALWRAQRHARITDAVHARAALRSLHSDVEKEVLPEAGNGQRAQVVATHQIEMLRRYGIPTEVHRNHGSVDWDWALARGLSDVMPELQMLHSQRMAELAITARFKRDRDGRQGEAGARVPFTTIVLAPALPPPRRARTRAAANDTAPAAVPLDNTPIEAPAVVVEVGAPSAGFDDAAEGTTRSGHGVDTGSIPTAEAALAPADEASDVEPSAPDSVMSDSDIEGMLYRVAAGPATFSQDEWLRAIYQSSPIMVDTKLHLATAYEMHRDGPSVDDVLQGCAGEGPYGASWDADADLRLFGPEFFGHYHDVRLQRNAAMATRPAMERAQSRRSAAREWIELKRLGSGRKDRGRRDLLAMLESEAERLSAAGYFG